MTDTKAATLRAAHCVIDSECLTTNATTRKARRVPTVRNAGGWHRKSAFKRGNPKSAMGRAVNQLVASLSSAASTACCSLGSSLSLMAVAFSFHLMFFVLRDLTTASVWAVRAVDSSLPSGRSRCSTRGWVAFDAELEENGASRIFGRIRQA